MIRAKLITALTTAILVYAGGAHAASSVVADHVILSVALEAPVKPGKTVWVAVTQDIAPGWHTYWRNPGDSGLPTSVSWDLPKGVTAGAAKWPVPQRFEDSGIVNYGYVGTATILVPLTAARDAATGMAKAHVSLLECEHMCIPENVTLDLDLTKSSGVSALFTKARADTPQLFAGVAHVTTNAKTLTVTISDPHVARVDAKNAQFYPMTKYAVDYDVTPKVQISGDTLTWKAARDPHSRKFGAFSGVLILPGQGAFAVTAMPPPPLQKPANNLTLIEAAMLALVGGLILNLMPCVLPVLSMKALALGQSGGNARALRRDGIFYFAGVAASFAAIGGILVALKSGGAALGWGFQLQSPIVTFLLALLMTVIGLNLLGVFETPLSWMGVGNHLTRGEDGRGAFFTGALAVLVASPCTAPFMGTALGFALTQSAPSAFGVFLALGAGFAFPFTALAFTPALVHLVPKPGHWMVVFKEFLAFPMFATAIWLVWVLSQQAGSNGLAWALSVGCGVAFIVWLLPRLPQRLRWGAGIAGVAILGALASNIHTVVRQTNDDSIWQPWSMQALADARDEGRPVLVDFSAAWCVTCLVNEHVALENPDVLARLKREHVVMLRGDWTNRSTAIAGQLAQYGRSGVPLYLLYPPNGQAIVLPQILTPSSVLVALSQLNRQAARSGPPERPRPG